MSMSSSVTAAFKRFIFWEYARGSWQYDIMVGIILLFIFLAPREWFRDWPRIPNAASIAMLPSEQQGSSLFWVDPDLLSGVPEAQWPSILNDLLRRRTGKRESVLRVQPVYDDIEKELKGYEIGRASCRERV